jgi:hypothetical protein
MADADDRPWPVRDSDRHGWPIQTSGDTKWGELLDAARLEVRKKRSDEEIALAKAYADAEINTENNVYSAVVEVSKGGIDRTRASAEFVEKAAAGIVAIYSAVLGAVFAVEGQPLPERGLIPAVFLGLAIVCATYFLAWLPNPREQPDGDQAASTTSGSVSPRDRLVNAFIQWVRDAAYVKRKWLRASVGFLAAGALFLPAPFITLGEASGGKPETADWPDPGYVFPSRKLELRQIVYQAQVNQAAETEADPLRGDLEYVWLIAALVAFGLVIGLAQLPPGGRADGAPWPEPARE